MNRLWCILIAMLSTLEISAQGFPFIRNYTAEDYHGNNINFDITLDKEGHVFVANFEGLMYYDHAKWRIIHTPGITRVTVVYTASDNTVWVGGYNYIGKIAIQANGLPTLQRIGDADLFQGELMEIYEDKDKLLFLVSNGNIYEIKDDKVVAREKVNDESLRVGMLDVINVKNLKNGGENVTVIDTVYSQSLNSEYDVIMLKNSGLIIKDKKSKKEFAISDANGLCSNNLAYATYDGQGMLWGVTSKGIFNIQVPSSYTHFTPFEGLMGQVLSIQKYNGSIYAGTDDGLFRLEGVNFVRVPGINHACWGLMASAEGLYAATAEGMFRLSPTGAVSRLSNITSTALLVDDSLVYSGEVNGLFVMSTDGGDKKKVSELKNIRKILKDDEGTIWLQNLYGSVRYRKAGEELFSPYNDDFKKEKMATIVPVNGKVEVVSAEETKPFPYPLISYTDANGVTWLTDNEGKNIYRWKDGIRQKDLDTFLSPIGDMTVSAILVEGDRIWLGGENGLTIINTKVTDPLLNASPKLIIRSVALRNDSVLWGGFGKTPERLPILNHDDNELHFTFSLDNTPIVGKNLYRYRINNGKWSAWSPLTHATLQNLTNGEYTFSVQARDFMGRMTDVTSISFHINPPFYYRWYMIIVYLMLATLLLYALFKFRLHQLEKDKLLLESTVQERTAEVVKQKDEIEEKSKSLETALKELGKAQNQLIRQEKMATLGKLTQGLIDRILNPLNYINNFTKLSEGLVKDVKTNVEDEKEHMDEDNYEDTIEVLDMITGNLKKVGEHGLNTTRILKAMEELLKDRSGGIVETNIIAVLKQDKEIVDKYFAKDIAQYHINFHIDVSQESILVSANPELLSKTFLNLMGNSMYALAKKAGQTAYEPELKVRVDTNKDIVFINVHDNGIGIEATIIDKIFDPFFTTKTTGEASGIGLYLCNEVVQNYNGIITANSVKDEFSEFIVSLPILKK